MTFYSWHKVFLKTLGEDLRIHPGISLGLVDHGNGIFLCLQAGLAGKYALIFVCMCVGMWGILAGVYILGVKEWVFHLGLAFLRSCFRNGERRAD